MRIASGLGVLVLVFPTVANAQDSPRGELRLQPLAPDAVEAPPSAPRDVRDESPRIGLTDGPFGLRGGSMWAAATGGATTARGQNLGEGGVLVGGAPIDRLSIYAFGGRTVDGRWAPSATLHLTYLGSLKDGYALGVLGRYKAEGFTEAGGEIELGLTGGLRTRRFYLDANAIFGTGLEEEEGGEMDGELKVRTGFAATESLRLGLDGRFRKRMNGDRLLAGGRTWDALGGPQATFGTGSFFAAIQGGPSTVGVASGVGLFGLATVGGTMP